MLLEDHCYRMIPYTIGKAAESRFCHMETIDLGVVLSISCIFTVRFIK